jgi:hypothetical protein
VKQVLILKSKPGKRTYLNELNVRKAFVESVSRRREQAAETQTPALHFDNFKARIGVFKFTSRLNDSSFGAYDQGFLEEEVKSYLMEPMSTLYAPTSLQSSHL